MRHRPTPPDLVEAAVEARLSGNDRLAAACYVALYVRNLRRARNPRRAP